MSEKHSLENTGHIAVACSQYTFDELAAIYNDARTDYIVPMPMNGRRMREYVLHYDIDLDHSFVDIDPQDQLPNGICMMGLRDERCWITRLGVIPARRRRRGGEFLMRAELERAKSLGAKKAQLEVIKGNFPAKILFEKLGFYETRELLVVRRPPKPIAPELAPAENITFTQLEDQDALFTLLTQRTDAPSWVEETASLANTGNMRGILATLPEGKQGWLVFQRTPFQLTHFVFSDNNDKYMMRVLMAKLHQLYPQQDTKIENIPDNANVWQVMQELGYLETFRRHEMFLDLA